MALKKYAEKPIRIWPRSSSVPSAILTQVAIISHLKHHDGLLVPSLTSTLDLSGYPQQSKLDF